MGFKDEAGLELAIKTTDAAIKRARNKELGIEEEEKVRLWQLIDLSVPLAVPLLDSLTYLVDTNVCRCQ